MKIKILATVYQIMFYKHLCICADHLTCLEIYNRVNRLTGSERFNNRFELNKIEISRFALPFLNVSICELMYSRTSLMEIWNNVGSRIEPGGTTSLMLNDLAACPFNTQFVTRCNLLHLSNNKKMYSIKLKWF